MVLDFCGTERVPHCDVFQIDLNFYLLVICKLESLREVWSEYANNEEKPRRVCHNMGLRSFSSGRWQDMKPFGSSKINGRHIGVPLVALLMGGLLYIYSRSAVHAAKRNAKLHRMADGGQINWHNESQRRHGRLDRPDAKVTVKSLFGKEDDRHVSLQAGKSEMTNPEKVLKARKKAERID